jgi:hypothetical protein
MRNTLQNINVTFFSPTKLFSSSNITNITQHGLSKQNFNSFGAQQWTSVILNLLSAATRTIVARHRHASGPKARRHARNWKVTQMYCIVSFIDRIKWKAPYLSSHSLSLLWQWNTELITSVHKHLKLAFLLKLTLVTQYSFRIIRINAEAIGWNLRLIYLVVVLVSLGKSFVCHLTIRNYFYLPDSRKQNSAVNYYIIIIIIQIISINEALQPFVELWLYAVVWFLGLGISPPQRPLPTHRTTKTQNKHTPTSMPRLGFEPTTPVSEGDKIVYASDRRGHCDRFRN